MSPIIPGSIVAIIHTRPGLVPLGRLFKAHLKLVFFDDRLPHARSPEPTCNQPPARPR